MKWTPQKTMNSAVRLPGRDAGEAEGVASGVGPAHDVVALVVVAEDEEPGAERSFGGADHGGELVGGRGAVALGERAIGA